MYRVRILAAAALLALITCVTPHAIGPTARSSAPVATARIQGVVARAAASDASPDGDALIEGARVRLRNLATGTLEQFAVTDAAGRFVFAALAPGDYLVEVVDAGGGIRVTSPRLPLVAGQTIGVFLRVGTDVPWFSGFFGNAAANAVATAAAIGVTAIVSPRQPTSPEQ